MSSFLHICYLKAANVHTPTPPIFSLKSNSRYHFRISKPFSPLLTLSCSSMSRGSRSTRLWRTGCRSGPNLTPGSPRSGESASCSTQRSPPDLELTPPTSRSGLSTWTSTRATSWPQRPPWPVARMAMTPSVRVRMTMNPRSGHILK